MDVWFNYVDVFAMVNGCFLGDATDQDIAIPTNDTFNIPSPINLKELIFKNKIAGANSKIVLVGVPMTKKQRAKAGVY